MNGFELVDEHGKPHFNVRIRQDIRRVDLIAAASTYQLPRAKEQLRHTHADDDRNKNAEVLECRHVLFLRDTQV